MSWMREPATKDFWQGLAFGFVIGASLVIIIVLGGPQR